MSAVDFFLKIDGIEGESGDKEHKNEIDVLQWNWGESNSGSQAFGGGGGAGKVSMQDFHFQMRVNKASPKLFIACATGQHIKSAILTCRKSGDKPGEYLKIYFSDIMISSYETGGPGPDGVMPIERISFNFAKIEHEYKVQDETGKMGAPTKVGYDLKGNVKV